MELHLPLGRLEDQIEQKDRLWLLDDFSFVGHVETGRVPDIEGSGDTREVSRVIAWPRKSFDPLALADVPRNQLWTLRDGRIVSRLNAGRRATWRLVSMYAADMKSAQHA